MSILPPGGDAVLSVAGRAGQGRTPLLGYRNAALPERDPGSSDIELTLSFELSVSSLLEDTRRCVCSVSSIARAIP